MAIVSGILKSKSLLFASFLLTFLFGLTSCHDEQQVNTSASIVAPKADLTKANDERFLVRAAEFKWNIILLSKLATRRAGTEEVRLLGQTLENAYRESKSKLGSLAVMKSIRVPYEPTQAVNDAYTLLNGNTIEDFDFAYCSRIIQDQKDGIALFEAAANDHLDPDVKTWATSMLPELRTHLSKAIECEAYLNPMSELIR